MSISTNTSRTAWRSTSLKAHDRHLPARETGKAGLRPHEAEELPDGQVLERRFRADERAFAVIDKPRCVTCSARGRRSCHGQRELRPAPASGRRLARPPLLKEGDSASAIYNDQVVEWSCPPVELRSPRRNPGVQGDRVSGAASRYARDGSRSGGALHRAGGDGGRSTRAPVSTGSRLRAPQPCHATEARGRKKGPRARYELETVVCPPTICSRAAVAPIRTRRPATRIDEHCDEIHALLRQALEHWAVDRCPRSIALLRWVA